MTNGAIDSSPHARGVGAFDEPGLQLRDITLRHRRTLVLDHAHLGVLPGSITALWGAPHSGKTSLLRVAAGLLTPHSGTIRVSGIDPLRDPARARDVTGWVPAARTDLGHVTPRELLNTFASGHALPDRYGRERIAELLDRTGLARTADQHAEKLTLAHHTKLLLACALLNEPEVLLLDEPLVGLDVDDRAEIGDLLRAEARLGTAILASAPDPFLLDEVADRSVQIEAGRITTSLDLRNTESGRRWRIASLDGDALRTVLDGHGVDYEDVPTPDGRLSQRAAVEVAMSHEEEATALLAALARAGVPVYGFAPGGPSGSAQPTHDSADTQGDRPRPTPAPALAVSDDVTSRTPGGRGGDTFVDPGDYSRPKRPALGNRSDGHDQ